MTCQARDCFNPVPPKRQTGGASKRYCTDRCRRRERDRRLHGFGTRAQQQHRIAEREALQLREQQARQRERELKAMLLSTERLLIKLETPCSCNACRAARARLDLRDRRLQRMATNKALIRILKGSECSECGIDHEPEGLHFHHVDPGEKLFNMSQARAGGYTEEQIRAEAAKCEVLCASCHRCRHGQGVREGLAA